MRGTITLVAALLTPALLAGCAHARRDAQAAPPWQAMIRDADRKRLAGLVRAWNESLAQARLAGAAKAVSSLGDMAVADAALPGPLPGPGDYRCRTVRIGVRKDNADKDPPVLTSWPAVPCRITPGNGGLWFEQEEGSQRIGGRLYPDGDRLVFLGSLALSGEMGMMRYGADPDRDQIGVLRAFGDKRWRLELPWPSWQSNLAIIEIEPA